jgi:site-specific DNA-cytosine methylase
MRAGLDAAGWECIRAIDNDADAVAIHRLAHGDARLEDVTTLPSSEVPDADVWVAGFPCQPFSSSGNRLGFGHSSGNVFEHLVRLMTERGRPPLLLLENVEGLLTNKAGHTMAVILSELTSLGYIVSWLLVGLQWFDVPQTRDRLFLIAAQPGVIDAPNLPPTSLLPSEMDSQRSNAFADLLTTKNISWRDRCSGNLHNEEVRLRPAIGKPKANGKFVFGPLGSSANGMFLSLDVLRPRLTHTRLTLGTLVAPNFKNSGLIRSIRYWTTDSGRGPTKLSMRSEPLSHCIGTSLGGAPLYAVPLSSVERAADRAAFLEFSNWHREQDGVLVMRLRPSRAVLLFGPHTEALHRAVTDWDAGDTRKYKVVGNMVAPICAKAVAELINTQLVANH